LIFSYFIFKPVSYGILNPMVNWPRGQFTSMGFKIPYDTGIIPVIWILYFGQEFTMKSILKVNMWIIYIQ
jgi:hypothetical protein